MKKLTTSDRLKQIMSERRMKQVDILNACMPLCEKYNVNITKSLLNQYVKGKCNPKQDRLTILALALNVSEVWLMGHDVSPEREVHPIRRKSFPLLGEIACGKPIFASEEHEIYIDASSDIKADFCLLAKGDSMIGARIHNGDVVFIRSQPTVDNGEIAAVIIGEEATLKRWYYYPEKNKLVLNAENPAYEPLVYIGEELEEVHCLGKAVSFMSNL